jgi:hypothetical protein
MLRATRLRRRPSFHVSVSVSAHDDDNVHVDDRVSPLPSYGRALTKRPGRLCSAVAGTASTRPGPESSDVTSSVTGQDSPRHRHSS